MTEMTLSAQFVADFAYRRRGLRISAQKLADAVTAKGVPTSRGIIANLESGRRPTIDLDLAVAIADVLDMRLPGKSDAERFLDQWLSKAADDASPLHIDMREDDPLYVQRVAKRPVEGE